MISIVRISLSVRVQGVLTRAAGRVATRGGTVAVARKTWEDASGATKHIRQALENMAHGAARCMYCDDNRGMAIDHFEPLERAPLRAFDWVNHLLACAHCNSDLKRQEYPVDSTGACLLIDPTVDDPLDHLQLMLASGEYEPVNNSPKGVESIRVFGLNRRDLIQGRQDAFELACSNIRDWHFQHSQSNVARADRIAKALLDSPFVDVVHAMTRLMPNVAAIVVGPDTVPALESWKAKYGP